MRSALDPKAQNKRVKFDKPLPVLEQRDKHKHPTKVFDVEEADPSLRPDAKGKSKKLNYVDELDKPKAEPIAKRTRAQNKLPATKVLANMSLVNKSTIDLTDLFKKLIVAVPAVICFILNAPVVMKPREKSLNGLQMSDIIPELGEEETLGMTDAVCNMNKNDFDRLKYIQAIDMLNEEQDDDFEWDKSLWYVKRALRHRGEHKQVELYVEFKDPNQSKQWVSLFALALQDPLPIIALCKKEKTPRQEHI